MLKSVMSKPLLPTLARAARRSSVTGVLALALAGGLAGPLRADSLAVIETQVLPGTERFAEATQALVVQAGQTCRPGDDLKAAWNAAFDAWLEVSHLRFGPLEDEGRATAIAFWPDSRGFTPRQLAGLIGDRDPVIADPAAFADVSVAARGLFALEMLLFDPQFATYGREDYTCALVQAVAADLSRMAGGIARDWRLQQAPLMERAGAPGNDTYLSPDEVAQVFYTALLTGLEFTADQRIGRPIGTFDRPRPARAEARRAGRSLRNVVLSLEALRDTARLLADDPIPETEAAFDAALARAASLGDPSFAGVEDPATRLKAEILQQQIQAIRRAVEAEIGGALGLSAGFNSADGD